MSNNVGDHLVSAQQATHAKLRAMIFSGELQAGQPMRQEEIARQLGVSRLPVREALNRLATEGLVELKPRRGFFVTSPRTPTRSKTSSTCGRCWNRARACLQPKRRSMADADALDAIVRALDAALEGPIAFRSLGGAEPSLPHPPVSELRPQASAPADRSAARHGRAADPHPCAAGRRIAPLAGGASPDWRCCSAPAMPRRVG